MINFLLWKQEASAHQTPTGTKHKIGLTYCKLFGPTLYVIDQIALCEHHFDLYLSCVFLRNLWCFLWIITQMRLTLPRAWERL
jgi:hypothetical protein